MFNAMNVIGSGMTAAREWIEVTSNNITNINTTRQANGEPYHRQTVIFQSQNNFDDMFQKEIGGGVKVQAVVEDRSEKLVFDPDHPDANEEGYVRFPEINIASEMTDLIMGQRSYEANVSAFNSIKKVMQKEQEIGRV